VRVHRNGLLFIRAGAVFLVPFAGILLAIGAIILLFLGRADGV
jgi:hypothetical protein